MHVFWQVILVLSFVSKLVYNTPNKMAIIIQLLELWAVLECIMKSRPDA